MYQQEIKFFWPLTEQIPLDLDYSECDKLKFTLNTNDVIMNTINVGAWVTASTNIKMDIITTNELVLKQEKQPGYFKRMLYKFMGITWEVK